MSDLKSLDEIIRNRARLDLITRVAEAAQPLLNINVCTRGSVETGLYKMNKEGTFIPVHAYEAINMVKAHIVEDLKPQACDAAVKAFVQRVDVLAAEIEDLRSN